MESFLIARIGDKKIAISIKFIHFVIRNNGIVDVPDMPDWMEGVITFRDKVIPVLNNEKKLKIKNDTSEKKRIVLCEVEKDLFFGLNIDEYLEIKKFDKKDIKKLTLKAGEEVIPIVNLKKIITEEEIELAKKI